MKIIFEGANFFQKRLISKVLNRAISCTNNNQDCLVINISFVSGEEIKKLNKEHRNINKVTDVLSFPLLDIKFPQTTDCFLGEVSPDGNLYLGDIVICKDVAMQQAKQYGHSLKREIAFLALHGLLHCLGYDHIDKEEEKIMMLTSENILSSLHMGRGNV